MLSAAPERAERISDGDAAREEPKLRLATPDMNENVLTTVAATVGLRPRSIRYGAWCRLTPACTG